jgi:hypothetical protein
MADMTVVYYTSNREHPTLESRIQATLREQIGDLPVISVSHKPIDFGLNICVGDVGLSNVNIFRQMLMGVQAATTPYVCTAEADILHPPEFFAHRPAHRDALCPAVPLWVLFAQRGGARVYMAKRQGSEGAMVAGRDALMMHLETMLAGQPQWLDAPGREVVLPYLTDLARIEPFELPAPLVTFKTDYQLHRRTPHLPETKTRELPYWGQAAALIERYMT